MEIRLLVSLLALLPAGLPSVLAAPWIEIVNQAATTQKALTELADATETMAHTLAQVLAQVLRAQEDDAARKVLTAAQDAWLAYRTAEVTAEGGQYRGGGIRREIEARAAARLTRERTLLLRSFLNPGSPPGVKPPP